MLVSIENSCAALCSVVPNKLEKINALLCAGTKKMRHSCLVKLSRHSRVFEIMMHVKFKQIYYPRVPNVMNTSLPHISDFKNSRFSRLNTHVCHV